MQTFVLDTQTNIDDNNNKMVHTEVDVWNLGMMEKQAFIERIFKVAEEDN